VNDYRYKDGACWQRFRIGRTQSAYWKEVATVEEFIFSTLGNPLCPDVFRLTFMKRDKAWTLDTYINLSRNCSLAFPTLNESSRYVLAFQNGTYITRVKPDLVKPAFVPLGEDGALLLRDLFVPIKDTDRVLTEHTIACKYFEFDFDLAAYSRSRDSPFEEWKDVNESLRYLLEYQRLPEDVIKMIYCFTGRMLGEIRESDNWERALFLVGKGGSGKSTFLESVLGSFFTKGDICNPGSNSESIFGVSQLMWNSGVQISMDRSLNQVRRILHYPG
jgi:hypothetical protein